MKTAFKFVHKVLLSTSTDLAQIISRSRLRETNFSRRTFIE